ncbi:hypothetical protein PP753_gp10 [Dinoroseobacter phage vB_DshP-R7L]|uniref:Uncharacterized protein n=1 Tax=Dinoroseobacter phage vB_DshP-R7L TaxID=2873349 RepID=A0AAE8XEE9_9CAUD|nr:hypothetical protein PP753_gp10 [Dinoroseobacter phage vB_DshP-R7L]UAT28849.1 hypothetical protein R7L_gp10 [Dinoroseobacter phage vB_DshP-R7L]
MIHQYLFLTLLTVLVGSLSFNLIADAVYTAVDAQINMQLLQVEKLR